jgi:transcriptional regulator with XRE-family HTH domain
MVRRRQLMAELRRLRDAAGLTQDEVADQLDWHSTKVMRIETGRTAPHPNDVRIMLGLYGVTRSEEAAALVKLAQDAQHDQELRACDGSRAPADRGLRPGRDPR